MTNDERSIVVLPPVEQIGIVVKDLDRSMAFYQSMFGWGPFRVSESTVKGCLYRGRPTDCRLKMAFAKSGSVEIELIQVLEGESIHTEFLSEHGEGIQHLRFRVQNVDEILKEWAKKGIKPVWQHTLPERGISWAYMDTSAVGGVMVELFQSREP
jgi:methylmalonyl-CoA/ethylmalonyl-CoA epimerase